MSESADGATSRFTEWRNFSRRVLKNRSIALGSLVLTVIVAASLAAPLLTDHDPVKLNPRARLQAPSAEHPFGTDHFGHDVFARVLYGGHISLQVGLFAVLLAASSGTLLGLLAGYLGGWVDLLIMRLIDVMLAFPGILLALVVVAVLGSNLFNVMLAVGVATVPIYTRVVRASTLSIKQLDYIAAAQSLGAPAWRILRQHIFPNLLAPLIVVTTNGIASAIIAGAALSFLGLGVKPPTPEWGAMLAAARDYLRSADWMMNFPGLAIMLTVMSINLLGDGLRDVLDPRLKNQKGR